MAAAQADHSNPTKPVWLFPELPQKNLPERWGHSGVYSNGKLYVYGGCRGGLQFSDVLMLDLESISWTVLVTTGQEPGARDSHTAVLFERKMVVFGGTSGSRKTNDVYVLDLDSLVWSRPAPDGPLPDPRESHSATMIDHNRVVVFGGSGNGGNYLNDIHVLDCQSMQWTYEPCVTGTSTYVPASRDSHSSVVVGSKLYVYGGDCGDSYLGDLDVLDLETFTWSKVDFAAAMAPGVRAGHSAVAVNEKIYVFGGAGDRVYYEDVWVLDVKTRAWSQLDAGSWQPQGRFSHVAALSEAGIIVYGGCGEDEKPLDELLVLHLGGEDEQQLKEMLWFKRMQQVGGGDQKRGVRGRRRPVSCRRDKVTLVETLVTQDMVRRNDVLRSTPHKSHCSNQHASKRPAGLAGGGDTNFQPKKTCISSENEDSSVSESEHELPVKSSVLSTPVKVSPRSLTHGVPPFQLQQLQTSLPRTTPEKAGFEVLGIVDGVFDSGYLMSAHVNGQLLRGVLFNPGQILFEAPRTPAVVQIKAQPNPAAAGGRIDQQFVKSSSSEEDDVTLTL